MKTETIRNIALISHRGAGKTSLGEALLFKAGATSRLGSVDAGTSLLDFEEEEKKRKTTITTAIAPLVWKEHKINILDTPGYLDFIGEVRSALRVVEGVILLIDAVSGVEVGTEMVWKVAEEYNLPCAIFVNKLEKENADFGKSVDAIKKRLSSAATPFWLPKGAEADLSGILNLLEEKEHPEREKLIEAVAETDDELLEKYLEEGEFTESELIEGIKRGFLNRKLFPIFCGSATKEVGTEQLLDTIVSLFPPPKEEAGRKIGDPFSGIVFKIISDPHVGELSFVRVFSGKMEQGAEIINMRTKQKEKFGHICYISGKSRQDTGSITAGDIGVAVKLKETAISDTLCSPNAEIEFSPIAFPEPAISFAINPKTKQDQERMSQGLHKLSEEDPTFSTRYDHELGQTIISGMGELHLEIMLDKLQHRFGTSVDIEKPRIAYRESIKISAKGEGKYKRQTGGRGQYGHALIEIEPLPPNTEEWFVFVNKIFGGAIPSKYIPAVEKGIKEAMEKGVLAGYPVKWIKVTLYDGSFHEVDSSDIAFHLAGSFSFKDAFSKAEGYLLEPMVEVEVEAPEEYTGDIVSDLNGRRGKMQGIEGGRVKAIVPQAEMYKYSTTLRSITQGRGFYTMKFSHYEELPAHIAQKVIEEAEKER
jgi:elongation factor G